MAKSKKVSGNTSKSKKQTITPGRKTAAKLARAQSTAPRKPAVSPKPTASSRSRQMISDTPGKDGVDDFVVSGQVMYADKRPAAGVKVVALDLDVAGENNLGTALTDAKGRFSIVYSAALYQRSVAEKGGPELVVRVYNEQGELIGQSRRVNNAGRLTEVNISLTPAMYRVRGTVRHSDGRPVSHVIVKAFDRDMRWEEPLGHTKTTESGLYEIPYTYDKFQRSEKGLADLVVRVCDEKNNELASSQIIFNAKKDVAVDLTLPSADSRGPSEFDSLVRDITPLLRDVPQQDLTEEDIAFLTADTGIDRRYIQWLVESARRHVETDIVDQFIFYGLFRQNLPSALDDLLALELLTLREALEKSSQEHVIRHLSSEEMDAIIALLRALQADHATTQGGEGEPASLGDLLRTVLSDGDKIRTVAQLYLAHNSQMSDAMYGELIALEQFSDEERIDIRLALQLGELSERYLPLVRELQRMTKADPRYRPIGNLSPYVRLALDDWKVLLHRKQADGGLIGAPATVPGDDLEERIDTYALSLSRQLEQGFPAATIVRRIEADSSEGSPFKESHADLTVFFGNNPNFDLGRQTLDVYLSTDRETKLAGIENTDSFTTVLKGIQRLSKLTPDYAAIRMLMANGLHSAVGVVAVGEYAFILQYSYVLGGAEQAQVLYRNAQHVQNTAMALYMNNAIAFRAPLPYVMGTQSVTAPAPLPDGERSLPSWTTLFGSLELCECRHCRSLYSPAAYLVDTLNFISDVPMSGDPSPLQNLLGRRPDVEHIELTCENSNTPMPYVDLVNELLEAHVVPRSFQLVWNAGVVASLDLKIVDDRLIVDFKSHQYILTDKASVRVESPGAKWTILDSSWAFVIVNHGQVEGISAMAWPQTSWSAKELKANPEHTHRDAYNSLRQAVYPWSQPFNLPIEEARLYLRHLTVQRHELLAVFLRGAAPDPESNYQVACEYLGLTPEEASIISGSTTGGPTNPGSNPGAWNFWGLNETSNYVPDPVDGSAGEAQGDWGVVLRRVSIFLQRSSLSYRELLDLLDTYYVNPRNVDGPNERTLGIVSTDGTNPMTCNTAKLALYAVGDDPLAYEAAYAKAHRFVRLARKLGWPMRDLDKAISAFAPRNSGGAPDMTEGFLVQLSHLHRLSTGTRIPVVNLLSLWAEIDHARYIDHLSDGEPAVPSLYAQMFISKTLNKTGFPENPNDLANRNISDHIAVISAAYGIGADDVQRLHADALVVPRIQDPLHATSMIQDDRLSLANLSRLYRHALLARIVGLPVRQYLTTLRLMTADPFAAPVGTLNTAATLNFIKSAGLVVRSGFSVDDLDVLLRGASSSPSGLAVAESDITAMLEVLRADLRQIAAENTFVDAASSDAAVTTDSDGELTRQKLALLNWNTAEIDDVVGVLNETHVFEAELSSLGAAITFPSALSERIRYDATAQRLRFKGIMSGADKTRLVAAPNNMDQAFRDAVEVLYSSPRSCIARRMRRFTVPVYDYALPAIPPGLEFPNTVKKKVYYDRAARKLNCIGVMTEMERDLLVKLSTDQSYRNAVAGLFTAPDTFPLAETDGFLTANDVIALFSDPNVKPAQRFALVLSKLLPYLRATLSERMVKQRVGEHTGLEASTVEGLLHVWVLVPGTTGNQRPKAMTTFVDPVFSGSNQNLRATPLAFPQQFSTCLLLHKIAAMIGKFAFSTELVRAMFEHGASSGWLDFNQLPLASAANGYALFPGWSRLAELARLRDTLPHGASAVSDWLTAAYATNAQSPTVIEALSLATEWNLVDVQHLAGTNGFNLSLTALRSEATVGRLAEAMAMLKRLRASAEQCLAWTRNATGGAVYARDGAQAEDIKNLVRAKYEPAQWLQLAGSLRDPLREKQRIALVDYLVAAWRLNDANALYAHLLIDVEMGPCMMTTRIKQAIASVQLYVQRTLMNLEALSELNAAQAKQWSTWRKQYRVWEANRKVLLYPENWIEPELRDDKTPFFKDLENELMQNDLTAEVAEDAFVSYLEKLGQVARLDVVGMYEDNDGARKVLHVLGRTPTVPHRYSYRRREGTVWTAWEKVELDIEGDHLIPVVWNRRLHLFWALFTEKSDQPTKAERENNEDPKKHWEIKFAWSEYTHKGWAPKKVSKDVLVHAKDPDPHAPQAPQDYSFKTRIRQSITGQQLSIECYGPTVTVIPGLTHSSTTETVTGPTINTQYIVSYFKRSTQPSYWYWLIFGKEDWMPLQPSEIDDIKILVKNPTTGQIYETLTLHSSGQYPGPGGFVTITEPVDFYVQSSSKQVEFVTNKIEFVGGLKVYIQLKAWAPSTTTTDTTKVDPSTKHNNAMQGIGEFALDDCHGTLALVQGPLALSPQRLEPIQGTHMQGMAMVEGVENGSNALGAMAVLGETPGASFRLLLPHQGYVASKFSFPFFFQDQYRTYYVPLKTVPSGGVGGFKLRFNTFFHPRMCELTKSLKRYGVDGLLTLENQRVTDAGAEFMRYLPNASLVDLDTSDDAIPTEDIDFRYEGAYSQYNWELFFHAPFMIATQLSRNQRFEEAQKWFHYLFDPTSTVPSAQGPERFWKVLPFFNEAAGGVQTLEQLLADSAKMDRQVAESASKPFNPHAIARMRIVAYMKSVVMHYIDNLLAWGDQLFGRDTTESINEATQLYILAAEILGKRPENIPPRVAAKVQTYSTLYDSNGPDSLSNALVEVEGYIFPSAVPVSGDGTVPELAPMPYFCTSPNDKLLGYWDLVADRLFKIRHCMNLAGVERSLPIYEPPIDPALLVRAAAAGIDLASALSDISAAAPHYRFAVMLSKATELCNDVKSLGSALLSALEKRDGEALSLLRSSHEIDVLKAVREIREQQIKEASANLEGLREFQTVVAARQQYYQSRTFMNQLEQIQMALTSSSLVPMSIQLSADVFAGIAHLIPNAKAGSPVTIGVTYGGANIASAVQAFGSAAGVAASILNTMGSMSGTLGGFQRRQEDWTHQADLATKELKQVEKQIAGAEIRLAIAEHELQNHDLQIEHSQEVDAFMRAKFTNRELYSWMVGQLSAVYFQSYQLAYDVAKRAERAYRFELGLRDSNFVQFGYWDSLKKGLLSGERLHFDLKRMDVAYLDQNRREHEIVKHISLAALDPMALARLKEEQSCFISLPEVLFDVDHPGHYLRRIKSVSVTVPCVTGPYTGVHCTLTLMNSTVRHSNILLAGKYERQADDRRFADSMGVTQSIVTSSGQNDSGLFETNLRDERFLPFEGAGAISEWRLQIPEHFPQFDYGTISDVVLHVRYTARDGGGSFKPQVISELNAAVNAFIRSEGENGLTRIFSLRQEFPTEWAQLTQSAAGARSAKFSISKNRFPFFVQGKTLTVRQVDIFGVPIKDSNPPPATLPSLKRLNSPVITQAGAPFGSLLHETVRDLQVVIQRENNAQSEWELTATNAADLGKMKDIVVVFGYTAS
ncbi:MAG: neuraminidase-like domain-containing protein [Nitrospirota bacterium]|nr:neuraminidase-like domain-containing protein [Nitrospirota bacterium]